MLDDLTDNSSLISPLLLVLLSSASLSGLSSLLLLLLDRLSGKMDRGSVKDKLLLVCGSKEGGAGGAAPWPPSNVFTSNELLNPDKNGLKLPPKAATTAAY